MQPFAAGRPAKVQRRNAVAGRPAERDAYADSWTQAQAPSNAAPRSASKSADSHELVSAFAADGTRNEVRSKESLLFQRLQGISDLGVETEAASNTAQTHSLYETNSKATGAL